MVFLRYTCISVKPIRSISLTYWWLHCILSTDKHGFTNFKFTSQLNLKCKLFSMYISNKFMCKLNFNWHLNWIEVCATQHSFLSDHTYYTLNILYIEHESDNDFTGSIYWTNIKHNCQTRVLYGLIHTLFKVSAMITVADLNWTTERENNVFLIDTHFSKVKI